MFNSELEKQLLADYDRLSSTYALLATKIEQLFRDILNAHGIMVHAVSSRVKSRDSIAKKISKSIKNYQSLTDITDIAGLRITTYFSEDVDRIGKILEGEFIVDPDNSVDKRDSLEANRFGYLSLHHVLLIGIGRSGLLEYQAFRGLKFEVQTRSILQHAWAEIEHDLGYKSAIEVPKHLTRRFALAAGQLESVDNEFNRIKAEIETYRKSLSEALQDHVAYILLSSDSINALMNESNLVAELDAKIAAITKTRLDASVSNRDENDKYLIPSFRQANILTIDDLIGGLNKYESLILLYADVLNRPVQEEDKHDQIVQRGTSLWYLRVVILHFITPEVLINEVKRIVPEGEERTSILNIFDAALRDFLKLNQNK